MHTQGKWKRMRRDISVVDDKGRELRICTMIQHTGNTAKENQDEANARLIAAAPETKRQHDALLEACKAMTKQCETFNWNTSLPQTKDIDKQIEQAQKAIKQAEGEE